jgi:hypothetical protein
MIVVNALDEEGNGFRRGSLCGVNVCLQIKKLR